jgi:hypothetical protein
MVENTKKVLHKKIIYLVLCQLYFRLTLTGFYHTTASLSGFVELSLDCLSQQTIRLVAIYSC